MKKLFTCALFIAAVASAAQLVIYPDGSKSASWPHYLYRADGTVSVVKPSAEECIAAGVARWETAEEQDDREAAEAAAQSEADAVAALAATLPATFATGIAVTNDAGHWVEFVPDGTNVVATTLAVQISQSPLTPIQRQQMKDAAISAYNAKKETAKTAKAKGNGLSALAERVAALEALVGIE